MNRRQFIGQASCAAIGSITSMNTLYNLMATNRLSAASATPPNDYKALVCILLAGGNDSYNMLPPKGVAEHGIYTTTRSNLALAQEDIIGLSGTNNGYTLGLHPSMTHAASMYEAGDLAFIANTGTLVEPIANETEYRSGLKRRPLGLFSHSDQIEQWQTSIPDQRLATGWGGRMADLLNATNSASGISMNISLSGRNVFQSGQNVLEYSISNRGTGTSGIEQLGTGDAGILNRLRNAAVDSLMGDIYGNVFKETFANLTTKTIESQKIFEAAMMQTGTFPTIFSNDDPRLSQNLRMMARVISAAQSLDQKRQIFFTTFGGWDHHDEVLNNQQVMLGMVSRGISQFYQALDEADPNLRDQVTLFTVSDFARTLTSNGNGSDHAWGGNMIVAGGAVKGKKIYGQYPDLDLANDLIISQRGNLIPTTSSDQVFAELAKWFGVSDTDLNDYVLPNYKRFDQNPLGFLL
ncbi:MAG: DUF1501 domain-containing protein [Bacteroidota bacterium]